MRRVATTALLALVSLYGCSGAQGDGPPPTEGRAAERTPDGVETGDTGPVVDPATLGGAPRVSLGTILEATGRCEDRETFSRFLEGYGFCYQETVREETFTYSTHLECGSPTMGADGLRVNFAVSDDGGLNSSLTTRSARFADSYRQELVRLAFTEAERDPVRQGARWFTSPNHPRVRLMWEELRTDDGDDLWHIGFVWRPRSEPDFGDG